MKIRWNQGGEAQILELAEEHLLLHSTIPSPPGSRPAGVLESGEPFRMKVHGCAKAGEHFVLRGRPLDLKAVLRIKITTALGSPEGGPEPTPQADTAPPK